MGEPHWTQEEKNVFFGHIVPMSQFSTSQYEVNTGMTWKELAPIMDKVMTGLGGKPQQRVYTEDSLLQSYYTKSGSHSRTIDRGTGDKGYMRDSSQSSRASSALPRTAQYHQQQQKAAPRPVSSQRFFQAGTSAGEGSRRGYVSDFTQTDPNAFIGFNPEEALSVHANPANHETHDIIGGGNAYQSNQDLAELNSLVTLSRQHPGKIGSLKETKNKRAYQDEDVETGYMSGDDYSQRQGSYHKETEWVRRSSAVAPPRRQTGYSSNAPFDREELPNLGTSGTTTTYPFDFPGKSKKQAVTSSFALGEVDSGEETERDPASFFHEAKPPRPNYHGNKRRKVDQDENDKPDGTFSLGKLEESSDGDLEIYGGPPPRTEPRGYGNQDTYKTGTAEDKFPRKAAGKMVDGIYRPASGTGFGIARLQSTVASATAEAAPSRKTGFAATTSKPKVSRSSTNTAGKKNDKKKAVSPSVRAPTVQKSKTVQSKMTNNLPQIVSKHPIEYTGRPLPSFTSVNSPRIPKRPSAAKPAVGGQRVAKTQDGGENRNSYKLQSSLSATTPNTTTFHTTSYPSSTATTANYYQEIPSNESLGIDFAISKKEANPEDAAPWAKAIAAKRGYQGSVPPVEDDGAGVGDGDEEVVEEEAVDESSMEE